MSRPNWEEYFLKMAEVAAARATCTRRKYGAVITTADHIIVSTGYCGAPRGEPNCCDRGDIILDKIDEWHDGDSTTSLHEYLGMSEKDYLKWVINPGIILCKRTELGFGPGEGYDHCVSVHAEQNAIIHGDSERMKGGTIYITGLDVKTGDIVSGKPCKICERFIKNAQIANVVISKPEVRDCLAKIYIREGGLIW